MPLFFYFFFYILFIFLILRFTVTLFNYISNPRLTGSPRVYHELVSIFIIPNGDSNQLLNSLTRQDHREYELFTFDHKNSDTLIENANGKFFLFIDSRARVMPGLINNAVHRMKISRISLLSLFPDQYMPRLADKIAAPVINYMLLSLIPLRLIRLVTGSTFSAASSQFLLFAAEDFKANEWESLVITHSNDTTRIMKQVKASGFNAETLLANGFLSVKLYKNLIDAFTRLSTFPVAPFQKNASGFFLFSLFLIPGPVLMYFYLNLSLFYFALTLIAFTRILISLSSGENILLNLLLHPFQMLYLLAASSMRFVKQFRNFVLSLSRKKTFV